jgi:hypothetical protein
MAASPPPSTNIIKLNYHSCTDICITKFDFVEVCVLVVYPARIRHTALSTNCIRQIHVFNLDLPDDYFGISFQIPSWLIGGKTITLYFRRVPDYGL